MITTIHPLVVHFPIALLTIYAVAELLRFKKINGQTYWFYLKAILVILGAFGALVARQTGEELVEAWRVQGASSSLVVNIHNNWSFIATWIFGVLAIAYFVAWLYREGELKHLFGKWCERLVTSWLIPVIALIGLAAITITGALGGAIVYGPDVDPTVKFIYSLLVH
jgi:uncharacterized membrane protein